MRSAALAEWHAPPKTRLVRGKNGDNYLKDGLLIPPERP